jgi:outer membrane protein insertion porin family
LVNTASSAHHEMIPDRKGAFTHGLLFSSLLIPLLLIVVLMPSLIAAQTKERVAVLPFMLHMGKPADHLSLGLQEMLTTRLDEKGFDLVDPHTVNEGQLSRIPSSDVELLKRVAGQMGINWVISGSLTRIGEAISLDLTIIPVSADRRPLSVFIEGDAMDEVPEAIGRAAAAASNRIKGIDQIEAMSVQGNKRIEEDAILAVIESQRGTIYDPSMLDKDLKSVYRMGYFEDVQIDVEEGPRGKIVTFKVVEKPSIGEIGFEGNEDIDEEDLKEALGIKEYSIVNMKEIKDSIGRLRDYYHEKRYYHVEITQRIEELPNNEVALVYEIEEGEKAYVRKIAFVGNQSFTEEELKDVMETSEKGLFSFVTHSGYLDRKELESDTFKLTSFYHNHGYIKAKIGEPEISYKEREGITITINIDEGPQYAVRDVSIAGDLIREPEEFMKKLKILDEKVYNREVIRADALRLSAVYADEGYAFVDVFPKIKEDDEKRTVDITYQISKGEKVKFERIVITGNDLTRDKVIRRELQVIEGGYFSGRKIQRSTQNLYRLGFFENVEINTKKGSGEDKMNLDIHVEERATGMLSFGVGYSSVEKTMGVLELSKRNLFGLGQVISTRASISSKATRYTLSFTEPWLFEKPLSAGIDLYNWEYEYDEYTKNSRGGRLRFGFPLGVEFMRGSVIYTYDNADISDISDTASQLIKDMEGENLTSSVTLGALRDSRDRRFNARSGSANSLSIEYAGGSLAGDNYFTKYTARSAWFFPLFQDSSFSVQGKWGFVEQRPGGKLPIYEKFTLGGMNTVRGFDYGTISPVDPLTGDRIGGEKMMVYNTEFRFPLQKEQGVVGVVFFDAGNVFTKDESYTFEGIRRSAGLGIRWYTPVGPLRLEWGYNLDRKEGEPSSNWEFTIGTPF